MPKQIIFIMTDSQGANMVGCYGNPYVKTPHLDQMAREGICFERAYDVQPVCQPARAALFTGKYPCSCASWSNCMGPSGNVPSLGKRLSDHGIHTAFIGKWHLDGGDYFGLGKCPPGWDPEYWYDMRCYLEELTPEEKVISRREQSIYDHDIQAEFTFGYRCTQRAIRFMKEHQNEDYFLVVSYDEPHGPFLCPQKYVDMYQDVAIPIPENAKDTLEGKPEHQRIWAGGNYLRAARGEARIVPPEYLGCNSFIDTQIGRVADAAQALAKQAILFYTSDHGDMFHSHSLTGKGPVAYEEITHVPFLVKGFAKGVRSQQLVSHINVSPTIMELFGLEPSRAFEGVSILPLLKDPGKKVNDYVFMEFGRYEVDHDGFGGFQLLRAVADGRYKLVVNLLTSDELYDLKQDPGEMENLIGNPGYQEIGKKLHQVLMEHMDQVRDPFRGYYWENRPWDPVTEYQTWEGKMMTRQREEDPEYESKQLDYMTGLEITRSVRRKGT